MVLCHSINPGSVVGTLNPTLCKIISLNLDAQATRLQKLWVQALEPSLASGPYLFFIIFPFSR